MRMIFLKSMLVAYGVSALFGILAVLSQDSDVLRMVGTSLLLAASFTVLLLLTLLRDGGHRGLRWLMITSMFLTAPVFLLYLGLIWVDFDYQFAEVLARLAGGWLCLVFWSLYVGFCFCIRVQATWFHVLTLLLFAVSLLYLLLIELLIIDTDIVEFILQKIFPDDEFFFRGLTALVILSSAASLSLPVIWLISKLKRRSDGTAMAQKVTVEIACPRCGLQQKLPTDQAACRQCRLDIRIRIEEPCCDCGFLLYRFEGEACPECGRPIPDRLRWFIPTPPTEPSLES